MENDGSAALTASVRPYDVNVVETDDRTRMRLAMQVSGAAGAGQFDSLEEMLTRLQPGRPAVVVFGPSLAESYGFEQMNRLTSNRPDVGVIVTARELSTDLLQQAWRAGARDVVLIEGGELMNAVGRVGALVTGVSQRAQQTGPVELGRLIVSFSTKGGVGKSTVATNVAVGLALRSGKKVAIVDADLQFGDVAVLLGLPPEHTVVDAAAAMHHGDADLMRSLVSSHQPTGLLVLPAPIEPSAADQVRPEQMVAIVRALQEMCGYVIVDMPPHFDDTILALLDAADDVLLVASMDIPSIKNLKVGMQTLDLMELAGGKLRLVLNRSNSKVMLDIKEIERTLGVPIEFPVASDIAVPQAVNRGVPVVVDNPRSPAAKGLEAIVDAFLGDEAPKIASDEEVQQAEKEGKSRRGLQKWLRRGNA